VAVDDLELVAAAEVQAQPLAQPVGEEGEAAGHQQSPQARILATAHQLLSARVELQPAVVDLFQRCHGHPGQQGHAPTQAVLVVGDFATHCRGRDGCHLFLAAHRIGNLVHALDVDQRGVHVEGDQAEVRQGQRRREALDHQAGSEFHVCPTGSELVDVVWKGQLHLLGCTEALGVWNRKGVPNCEA
jgi:hypothetical protein